MSEATVHIVVGVDGSPASLSALRWAAHQAQMSGGLVSAVTAWHHPVMYGAGAVSDFDPEETARAIINREVGLARLEYPDVHMVASVWPGSAGEVLVGEAKGADLLIVGAKGHGRVTGMVLGSTSQYCVSNAECSVTVVR